MTNQSERYEMETITPAQEVRKDFSDLDDAMIAFYEAVAANYSEPSVSLYVHDLVAGTTLAVWVYDPDANYGKVVYEPSELRA